MSQTEYDFVQEIDNTSLLQAIIVSSSIATSLLYINTLGSGSSMQVSIVFSDILSSNDQTTLNSIMQNYVNNTPETVTYMLSAITTSIQTDANLIILLRAKVSSLLPTLPAQQLQLIMTLLGLT